MNSPIERHRKLVEQNPDNELARFSLGKALFDVGDHAGALEQFRHAVSRRPDWMAVQILVGRCELALGNVPAARAALVTALELARAQGHEGPRAEVEEILAAL